MTTLPPASGGSDVLTVLGVDPGTLVTGYGIIARSGRGMTLVTCGTIRNDASLPLPARLLHIHQNLCQVIETFHPDEFAIESAFYGKNAQSALKLGHARGVSLLAAVQRGIPTAEYSPREVKKAVTGNGQASKQQIAFMVRSILSLGHQRIGTDASDAIAVSICHLHRTSLPGVRYKDWKGYLVGHPERVVE